jgi:hypothetical protein
METMTMEGLPHFKVSPLAATTERTYNTLQTLAHVELCELRIHAHALANELERLRGSSTSPSPNNVAPTTPQKEQQQQLFKDKSEQAETSRLEYALERAHGRTAEACRETRVVRTRLLRGASGIVLAISRRIARKGPLHRAWRKWQHHHQRKQQHKKKTPPPPPPPQKENTLRRLSCVLLLFSLQMSLKACRAAFRGAARVF